MHSTCMKWFLPGKAMLNMHINVNECMLIRQQLLVSTMYSMLFPYIATRVALS